jgi:hypothetical protein
MVVPFPKGATTWMTTSWLAQREQNIIQLPNKQDIEQAKQSSRTLSKYGDA